MRKNMLFFLGATAGVCLTLLVTTPAGRAFGRHRQGRGGR